MCYKSFPKDVPGTIWQYILRRKSPTSAKIGVTVLACMLYVPVLQGKVYPPGSNLRYSDYLANLKLRKYGADAC